MSSEQVASQPGHHDAPRDAAWVFHGGGDDGPRFMRAGEAGFNLHERGVTFGDGVYEVVRYDGGAAFALDRHVARLRRSLRETEISGLDVDALAAASAELLDRNGWADAKAYWQVTRGRQPRDFVAAADLRPTVTAWLCPAAPVDADAPVAEGAAVFAEDVRWLRCDIKSLLLMPASLARTRAARAGAIEAIFVREKADGRRWVTEGTSTNVMAVKDGVLWTHPADRYVLHGVTRAVLLEVARAGGLPGGAGVTAVREEPFTPEWLRDADEVLVCSTTRVAAITSIDGAAIGSGAAGPVTRGLHAAYLNLVRGGAEVPVCPSP